jgi:hypothetical protein
MGPIEIAIRLVADRLLILTNGFFVAIEFALTPARQFSESEFIGGGTQRVALERAWEMSNDPDICLTVGRYHRLQYRGRYRRRTGARGNLRAAVRRDPALEGRGRRPQRVPHQ